MTGTLRPEKTGPVFEQSITDMFQRAGGLVRRHVVVGRSIYGTPWEVDLLISNAVEYPCGLIVECKWQEATGTADEKYPYLVANIQNVVYQRIVPDRGEYYPPTFAE